MVGIAAFVFWGIPALVAMWLMYSAYVEYRRDRVPILLYHRLLSKADADAGRVPDDEMIWVSYDTSFDEQMRYLKEAGYTTLDLDDYVEIRSGSRPLPNKPVIVTFDDGYLSNYTLAYPELKKHGHKAVIYTALEPDEHTRAQVEGVDGFLTTEQMQEMSENGISIQSHTVTHCILSELGDEAARYELDESRRRLEAMTGKLVQHLAIPRAGYSRRIRKLVAQAGYKTACANAKGSGNGLSDLLALPRIVIERDMTISEFRQCLTPRAGLVLRIIGNIKRIPEHLGGARFARKLRNILYSGPWKPLFSTRNLKWAVMLLMLMYLFSSVAFTLWIALRGD